MTTYKTVLTSVALATLILTGCGDKQATIEPEKLRPVRTVLAAEAPQGLERRFAGTTDSSSTTELSFRVSGTIQDFPATTGEKLKAGDVIAQLDTADLALELERSKAELAEARTVLAVNKSRFKRLSDPKVRQVISEMDYELVKAKYEGSQAQASQSERAVDLQRQQMSYAKLFVPTDNCSLSSTYASVNENISAGQPIATLNCGNTMEVTSIVSDTVASSVEIGQTVEAIIKTAKETKVAATITEIGLSSTTSGLSFVTAQLDESLASIRPSMPAELLFNKSFDGIKGTVWIPMVAINEDQGVHYVMVFESTEGIEGIVRKTPIQTGKFAQGYFQVTQGLSIDQQVITAGLNHIYDGLKVKLLAGDVR